MLAGGGPAAGSDDQLAALKHVIILIRLATKNLAASYDGVRQMPLQKQLQLQKQRQLWLRLQGQKQLQKQPP
ncbi:hypothetical protein ACVBEF_16185 [Glaciimonas sp. GG7]